LPSCFAFAAGAFALGIYLSLHFGKVRRADRAAVSTVRS
jgi:hypothetical protein